MMHIDRQLAQSEGEREKFLNELHLEMTEPARALSFTLQIGPKPKKKTHWLVVGLQSSGPHLLCYYTTFTLLHG